MDEEKKEIYIDGYYRQLLDDFKDAVENHNTSIVLIFDGKSGKGKTTLSNQTGNYLDPNFGLKNIYYDPEEFLKGLANSKPGDYYSFDEAMIISSRSAMSQVNKMIIQAMSMIRSKKIYVSFCVNAVFDLDRNLVLSRADALLHVYGEGLVQRGRFASFFKSKADQRDRLKELYLMGKKFYDYRKPRANFIGRFTKAFVVNEKKYEELKQVAINKFLTQESTPATKRQRSYETLIFKLVRFEGFKKQKVADLAEVNHETIRRITKKFENTPEIPIIP
ncbi:hypothetical protein LCGC14_0476650 [marine sediment metagenome]|uniref:Uncharacterized protein n=1 Tax=marine sediment metagenome TaxID=412755 RepID=A0A0F9STJ8_9ZZZZ|nr:hypothetical protein [bacterium]